MGRPKGSQNLRSPEEIKQARIASRQRYNRSEKGRDLTSKQNLKRYDPSLTKEQITEWINKKKTSACEACGSTEKLVFDHDHSTTKMRGILCDSCNTALGRVGDDHTILNKLVWY